MKLSIKELTPVIFGSIPTRPPAAPPPVPMEPVPVSPGPDYSSEEFYYVVQGEYPNQSRTLMEPHELSQTIRALAGTENGRNILVDALLSELGWDNLWHCVENRHEAF